MKLTLAEPNLSSRQALGTGRLSEQITGNTFNDYDISLSYVHTIGSGIIPVTLHRKNGGYFALQLAPERSFPDFTLHNTVTLTAKIIIPERGEFSRSQSLLGSELTLIDVTTEISGTEARYRSIRGAPFDFSISIPPKPVALQGHVLRDNDPANPIAGARISTSPALPEGIVTTNTAGIFFASALPTTDQLQLTAEDGTSTMTVALRPDYDKPINTTMLSLPIN